MAAATSLSLAHVRAFWCQRQALVAPGPAVLPELVSQTGWVRTLGGVDAYLALKARRPDLKRTEVDADLAAMSLRVLPAVRSCIYLVPEEHAALVLRFAQALWRPRAEKDVERAKAKWTVVEETVSIVREALPRTGLTTDALRKALPPKAIPSFGEAGKKVGLSSPLPLALRELEFSGEIERTLEGGRLDSERYIWRKAARNIFAKKAKASSLTTELAQLFFRQFAPATLKQFAEWAGVSLKEAKAATALRPLTPVTIDGMADALVLDDDLATLRAAKDLGERVTFLSFEDNYVTTHGSVVLTDPQHHDRVVPVWGQSRPSTLGAAKHLANRSILVGGALVGFWEFEPDRNEIVTGLFAKQGKATQQVIREKAREWSAFIRDELGHGRSFSLDTEDSLRERAEQVRSLSV